MPDVELEPYAEALTEFPITGTPSEKLAAAVAFAVRAPSNRNSQPWVFRIAGDTLELRADRSRALPVVDPDDRELIISCGAALFHVGLVLRHYGTMPRIERSPDRGDPDLLARVYLGAPRQRTAEDEALYHAIPGRHTYRRTGSRIAVSPMGWTPRWRWRRGWNAPSCTCFGARTPGTS